MPDVALCVGATNDFCRSCFSRVERKIGEKSLLKSTKRCRVYSDAKNIESSTG